MPETQTNDPICVTCKDKKSNHFDDEGKPITQHQFTTEEEPKLESREQRSRRLAKSQHPSSGANLAALVNAQPNSVGRLTEVLLDKKIITAAEALYVAGMASKPEGSGD